MPGPPPDKGGGKGKGKGKGPNGPNGPYIKTAHSDKYGTPICKLHHDDRGPAATRTAPRASPYKGVYGEYMGSIWGVYGSYIRGI